VSVDPTDSDVRTGASAAAIAAHYDMGDAFFRLVLDQQMNYSCALFQDGDDLATAQIRKLDFHIEAAAARGARRVLDIGCGWGAMLRRLVSDAQVSHAVGLTLSPAQFAWNRAHLPTNAEVLEQDWRDHRPAEPYDAIVSIGAFEHFVQKGLSPEQRMRTYAAFFERCAQMLRPGGRLSLQTIAYPRPTPLHPYLEETFPDSDLPLFWEPLAGAQARFQLVAMRNDGAHYERTLACWEANLARHSDQALALVGEPALASFRRYLRLSRIGFKHGYVGLLRISFIKD
jgi:cyclopropane-fatty-acyl-phospholipid synthase